MTQLTIRNDVGRQPKPRSLALTNCIIDRAELRHFEWSAVSFEELKCVIGGSSRKSG